MELIHLDNIRDSRLDVYANLTNHQLRNNKEIDEGIFIAESEIAIRVALEQGYEPLSFLLDERKLKALHDLIQPMDVPVFIIGEDKAQGLCGYAVTRGALAAFKRPAPLSLDQLLEGAGRVVLVEGVTDTSNIGAIFRNAAALGMDGVIVADSADPLCRRSVRTSMGCVLKVPWYKAEGRWPYDCMEQLKDKGFHRVALALRPDALPIDDPRLAAHDKLCLVLGSEGKGLTQKTLGLCDSCAIIPMHHQVDSLNVACASAIAMWQLR